MLKWIEKRSPNKCKRTQKNDAEMRLQGKCWALWGFVLGALGLQVTPFLIKFGGQLAPLGALGAQPSVLGPSAFGAQVTFRFFDYDETTFRFSGSRKVRPFDSEALLGRGLGRTASVRNGSRQAREW